jgi:(p)ppGpp synthase/HD superfamily hydrolase
MNFVQIAELIARRAHAGQYRRDGKTPYITHPERVAAKCKNIPEAEAVAWLHDVLEDTDITAEDLLQEDIPKEVVTAVELLTKRGESYEDYLYQLRKNTLARIVKIQDMIDNLSDGPTPRQLRKYAAGLAILAEEGDG